MAGKQVSTDSMYLIPPSIFNVDFMIDGVENKFLPKYGNCVFHLSYSTPSIRSITRLGLIVTSLTSVHVKSIPFGPDGILVLHLKVTGRPGSPVA